MSDGMAARKTGPACPLARPGRAGRWIAAALALALLAACENGGLSYDPNTGLFSLPLGAQSHKTGGG